MEFQTFDRYARIHQVAPTMVVKHGFDGTEAEAIRTFVNTNIALFVDMPVTEPELRFAQAAVQLFCCHLPCDRAADKWPGVCCEAA